jgi:hypothetical protein
MMDRKVLLNLYKKNLIKWLAWMMSMMAMLLVWILW